MKEAEEENKMKVRARVKLKKLMGGMLALSLLLSGLYTSPVRAEENDVASPPEAQAVSIGDAYALVPPEGTVKAADGEYTFVPGDLTAAADQEVIVEGTVLANYFKSIGTVKKRINTSTGAVTSIEVGSKGSGALQFTVAGTADVVIGMSSTGSSNTSAVSLVDASGNAVANKEGITTVTGTSATTMTYSLSAGTYQIISPANDLYNRGARILSVNVKEAEAESVTNTYTFVPGDLTAAADQEEITEGTTIAEYFKSMGTVKKRINKTSGVVTSIEVGSKGSGALQFTVTGTADVVIGMSSTGTSNISAVSLVDAAGTAVDYKSGITTVQETYATTMTYSLSAGTYQIISPANDLYNRGARILSVNVKEAEAESVTNTYTFVPGDLTAAADQEEITEGTTIAEYFKSMGTVKKRINKTSGVVTSIEVGSKGSGALQFTVTGTADVVIGMSSTGTSNISAVSLVDAAGTAVDNIEGITTVTGTSATTMTYKGLGAGTYRILSPANDAYNRGARILSVTVTETTGGSRPERADWSTVADPVIDSAALDSANSGKINVSVSGLVGYDGADKVTVVMLDAAGNEMESETSAKEVSSHTLTFIPSASGAYTFKAVLIREGETDKESAAETFSFVLPLAAPVMKSVTSAGKGTAAVKWNEVPEADSYIVSAVKEGDTAVAAAVTTSELQAVLTGLAVGQRYVVSVVAVRGTEQSKASSMEVDITSEAQREWVFAAFGASIDTKNNNYIGNINEGSVTVYSEGGKGKIQTSHDGLAFYYTEMDPETENFTITADIHVDGWTYSNAQEGFGMMAADAVGTHGDSSSFFNNSFQAVSTKIEYNFDGTGATSDTTAAKISMKLGLGYNARQGVTAQDIADMKAGLITMPPGFLSESGTFEVSAGPLGAGTYNLIGNCKTAAGGADVDNLLTDIRLQIQRNNTGYILRYLDQENNVLSEKLIYDLERNALTQIDADHIYVGFFAARNARITVTNMTLTTIAPEDDAPAEGHEIEYIYPKYSIESAEISNSADYTLVYYGNADGTLTIAKEDGSVVVDGQHVLANTKNPFPATLVEGTNQFTVTFTPDADYKPGEYQLLTSYETQTFTHSVTYSSFNAEQNIYVSPDGLPSNDGSKYSPMDIYTAVQYVKPGQYIMLAGGTYNLDRTVKVERGINGTEDDMIYMIADPETEGRPVFDFGGKCAGMVLAGDYWYFQGFDVTRSADAQKGIQVSGSYNILDQINTYKNGNTGIQISRYRGTDEFEDWPAYNLILNCTSYLNADKGYEDADGFAAKLTVGEGNVFDGCISAYNADDGWDLFAKVQTGSIGAVTIQNCVAFKNGYVLRADGGAGDLDLNGVEVNAGNGNGFKMGGDSMSGYHVLINSISFDNKAKGIDSNSCPDIQVYSSTSFDNESYNVAFYTNNAPNTDFYAEGILSLKVSDGIGENLKPRGTQAAENIENDTNYYFNGTKSFNKSGAEAGLDWFVRTDVENAMFLLGEGGRNVDGTINMQGLLELTDAAPAGVGARLSGNSIPGESIKKPERSTADTVEGIPEGSVPEEVLSKVGCGNAAELTEYLKKDILASSGAAALLGTVPNQTAAYQVHVQISLDGGVSWESAT